MVNLHPKIDRDEPTHPRSPRHPRFNVLLTEDRPHADLHWTAQLARLLEPQGVVSYKVRTGVEAIGLAERTLIHAAVIDLGTPIDPSPEDRQIDPAGGGMWILDLMRKLPNSPPVVILRKPAFSHRQAERVLNQALKLGAFCVLSKPVDVEQLLAVFRRLMDRRYSGSWPQS